MGIDNDHRYTQWVVLRNTRSLAAICPLRQPGTKVVPNENFCTQHRGCKVSFLVLLDEAPQGQEGERRDRQLECYPREAPNEGQELRYLDPIRFSLWYPQHVQGVPRDVKNRCC